MSMCTFQRLHNNFNKYILITSYNSVYSHEEGVFIAPELTLTKTPVFYNKKYMEHKARELADENCNGMYLNSIYPNLIHSGELGNENMNKLFKKFAMSEGHIAITKAYTRLVLLFNKWNEIVYKFYNNADIPEREKLKEKCNFSNQLWTNMSNIMTNYRQLNKLVQIINNQGYCVLNCQPNVLDGIMYQRAAMDQLQIFTPDENEWYIGIYLEVMSYLNRNKIACGAVSSAVVYQVNNHLFEGKMDYIDLVPLLENCARFAPRQN